MVHMSKNIFFIELVWLIFHPFLSDALQGEQREKHFLHYKFTAQTKANTFPEFSAEVVADDRRIKHFNNEERVWIRTEDDWTEPPDPPDSRDWFIHQIRTLTNCTNSQCSELHVLQRIIGCELEKLPDGTVNLTVFDEYGFDGEDFTSFNSDTMQWIDKSPKAKETKEKWNSQTGRNQFIKYYLKTYMNWISTFNNTKQSSPDVHIFARKAAPDDDSKLVLTCLATGFYPRDVQMNIRLNKTNLENQTSSGIRPNDDETFQMRISVKIDRNHEGSYDCLLIHSSLTEPVTIKWAANCADCGTNRPPILLIIILSLAAALVIVSGLIMIGINYYKTRRLRDVMSRSKENVSSHDCNREMLKRSEPHPPHTDQLSSFDDKNGQMITVMEERCAVMTEKEDPNKHVSNSHPHDPDLESSVFI